MSPLPSKSRFAFDISTESLPVSAHGNLYLWTFTFSDVLSVSDARERWSRFLDLLRRRKKYRDLHGLRVFELHPGGHGLHIHVLTGCFMHVNDVRALWRSVGGGRIHVVPIPPNRAKYAGKYLRKQGRPECFKSVRLWAAFGGWKGYTRVRDVTVENNWTRARNALRAFLGAQFAHLRWYQVKQAVRNVELGLDWRFGLTSGPAGMSFRQWFSPSASFSWQPQLLAFSGY